MYQDISSLTSKLDFSRREFFMTSLAIGFAAAVQPITAQTLITTDSKGLIAGEVKIPVSDGEIPGYRAMPDTGGPFPTVLVVQEIFGVHEHIKDVCRRFAKVGHMAVAPELYARQGDVSKITEIREVMAKVVSRVPDAQVMSDLDATVKFMKDSGKGNVGKLGITGFCWGGRIVWLYSAHNPSVKAGVAWYGNLVRAPSQQPNPLQPKSSIDIAANLKVPVLGLYGGADQGIPLDTIEQMRTKLKESSSKSEIVVYPDAPHGFHADYRPSYRKEAAEDGWKRLNAWFKSHGAS